MRELAQLLVEAKQVPNIIGELFSPFLEFVIF